MTLQRWMLVGAGCLMVVAPALAQGTAASAKVPLYDVVSIKPNKEANGGIMINQGQDRYAGTNVTLKFLLRYAYKLTTEDQIFGLPGWAESTHFNVEAKMDAETVALLKTLPNDDSATLRRKMMQAMLAERFQLKVREEKKELPVYSLVVAKGGLKMKEAAPNATYAAQPFSPKTEDGKSHGGMMMIRDGALTGQAIPVGNLADFLGQTLHRQVANDTGLTGKYDMELQFARLDGEGSGHDAAATGLSAAPLPSIFTALQEQLGLKLESAKGPVDTIVVDHVEMPSEN